jgi:superfamily I DNA and RNA helicase
MLIDLCDRSGREYDAVLVDEAQDFQEDWLDALSCLLSSKDDSVFVLYGDPHQTLWQRGWESWLNRHHWPHFELFVNCRNSLPIARKVASVFGDSVRSNGASGADPVFHQLDVRRENIAPVVSLVRRAIDEEGIEPEQIALLTSSRELAERFQATMVFDYQFAPVDRPGHIIADTIHRFKGLEAAFVVVVLGAEVGDGEDAQFRELKYTAYSRPTAVLHVFAPKGFKR